MSFNFTRVPSTKTSVSIENQSLVQGSNTLVIIGRMAASGSTATANVLIDINNYGDSVAAATECDTKFGSGSEVGAMVVAAIKANEGTDLANPVFPPIKVLPLANGTTDLTTALADNVSQPMPFVVSCFPGSDSTNLSALKTHLTTISGDDRGKNGQFGSFGFIGTDEDTTPATTEGTSAASQYIIFAWLRDLAVTKANKTYEAAAALGALCAGCAYPFMPLNGAKIGGLAAPSQSTDWHTAGDTGTEELGLAAGLVPLMVDPKDSSIRISRTITSIQTVSGTADASYYDMQDWQALYAYRLNCYVEAQKDTYKLAKASDRNLLKLKSAFIRIAKQFEADEVFQYVDSLADQFTVTRPSNNRYAGVYNLPVNVVPGFHNKGIGIVGTTQFDSFQV